MHCTLGEANWIVRVARTLFTLIDKLPSRQTTRGSLTPAGQLPQVSVVPAEEVLIHLIRLYLRDDLVRPGLLSPPALIAYVKPPQNPFKVLHFYGFVDPP